MDHNSRPYVEVRFSSLDYGILLRAASGMRDQPDLRSALQVLPHRLQTGQLLALQELTLQLYPHQYQAVRRVVEEMYGRAILADEVGLGKTIEAGVIAREYLARGLVKTVLILTPASLVNQWRAEMKNKLNLTFGVARQPDDWTRSELVLGSLDLAKRSEHAAKLCQRHWDLVIVDEAHRLKNRRTRNHRFVDSLEKKFLLLLTATPLQNSLRELYNLVNLLYPGYFSTYKEFKRTFLINERTARDPAGLRTALRRVMVRSKRSEVLHSPPKRIVRSYDVSPSDEERSLYERVVELCRRDLRNQPKDKRTPLPYIVILREVCSSPAALLPTLRKMMQDEYPGEVAELEALAQQGAIRSKLQTLQQLVEHLRDKEEKAVLFTEFRRTADFLNSSLEQICRSAIYHGGLTEAERSDTLEQFADKVDMLICTDAGSEGQNLQFCRHIINFDLPWNPTRLEQRIGRIHRLGQMRDVYVHNLYLRGTIEYYIIYLLEQKVKMFETVVGEIGEILADIDGDSFAGQLAGCVLNSRSQAELERAVERFGSQLTERRARYKKARRFCNLILDGESYGA